MTAELQEKIFDSISVNTVEAGVPDLNRHKLTRKIDVRILPLLLVTYSLQFMDKLALSSSSVFGVTEDNHLVGQDYSWVSSIFYFGFLAGQIPISRLAQLLPLGKLVGSTVFFWGVILACSAACSSYAGLLVTRFFLGLLESAVSPIFMIMTSMWYFPEQQPLRTSFWFAGNDVGGILSSFISYGIGHIHGSLKPWRFIFIIYGGITVLWGLVLVFFLPDSPQSASFLTEREKEFFANEKEDSSLGNKWNWDEVRECFADFKTYLLVGLCILNVLPNGGVISYGFIIIDTFGYSPINTTLLNVPGSVITWISIVVSGYAASHIPRSRSWVMICIILLPIAGAAIIYHAPLSSKRLRLGGYYMLMVQPSAYPSILAMISSNYQGYTKRPLMGAVIFLFYCASNIAAPQLFISSEAPKYYTAYKTWIICFALTVLLVLVLRFHLMRENKKRDLIEVEHGEKENYDTNHDTIHFTDELLSDKMDKSFRYLY